MTVNVREDNWCVSESTGIELLKGKKWFLRIEDRTGNKTSRRTKIIFDFSNITSFCI